jgi:hypothetical protein
MGDPGSELPAAVQRQGSGVVYEKHDFDAVLAMWKQRAGTKVAPVPGAHAGAPVFKGPETSAAVRSLVAGAAPAGGEAPTFLAARVKELQGLGLSSEVEDADALIPVLAGDMQKKDAAKPTDERANLTEEGWLQAAKSQIEGNTTTALTTSDDRYTAIKGGVKFDELHEFVHICSAPGGESSLMHFNLNMNEGAINLFSELVAPLAGVTVVERYPQMTAVVRALVRTVTEGGGDGLGLLYAAAFKGDVDGFFAAVGAAFASGELRPNDKTKGFSDKKWTAGDAARELKKAVQNWSVSAFNNYLL